MICTGKISSRLFNSALVLLVCLSAQAMPDSVSRATWVVNPRVHTSGYFPFTGALLNRNLVADVNVFFEKKSLGFSVLQSVDLQDRKSYVNYLQPGVFATWHISPHVRLRGFFGYVFSQTTGFCDPESDYYAAGQVNWIIANGLRIENTLLYYDYTLNQKLANRLLVEWALKKVKLSGYVWQRTVIDEGFNSTSGAIAVTVPFEINKKVSVELTATYMGYFTETKPEWALRDGAFITLAVPLSLQ